MICPSTGPVLQGSVSPARTASRSPSSPSAKRRSAGTALACAAASQASNRAPCRARKIVAKSCVSV